MQKSLALHALARRQPAQSPRCTPCPSRPSGALRRMAVAGLEVWLIVSLSACAAGPQRTRAAVELDAVERGAGPRAAVAVGFGTWQEHSDDPAPDATWLAAAWEHRGVLEDDRVLRAAVASLRPQAVPASLRPAASLERALTALRAGDLATSHLELVAARRARGSSVLDGLRGRLLEATLVAESDQEAAAGLLQDLVRVPRGRAIQAGPLGPLLLDRARLLLASLYQQARRYREAIALYLQLGPASGHFREARLGLAWCQLLGGNPERAIEVLALLPGGLTGDPERAVLAAMAAHGIGRPDAAHAVIDEARELASRWAPSLATPEAVLSAVRPDGGEVPLRQPEDGIVEAIADDSATRHLAAELLATRQVPNIQEPPGRAWLVAMEQAWAAHVTSEAQRHAQRVAAALESLAILEPQIPRAAPAD